MRPPVRAVVSSSLPAEIVPALASWLDGHGRLSGHTRTHAATNGRRRPGVTKPTRTPAITTRPDGPSRAADMYGWPPKPTRSSHVRATQIFEIARATSSRAALVAAALFVVAGCAAAEAGPPQRILVDTDTDTDDLLALLYILKQSRSEFDLKVFHSGIPITLVPLDATNTIPINEEFFYEFQRHQSTYEAQYCFKSLKMARDTWFHDRFYTSYFMWDSFTSGVAISSMLNDKNGEFGNDFAELEYMNITVITSNKPYGVHDGSNPLFDGRTTPKFGLQKGGVHSGHVQTGIMDSFCRIKGSNKGRCEALNGPENSGSFDFKAQFPFYREILYKPDFKHKYLGRPVIVDMDMSPGDFMSLIYLLKAPIEVIDVKGILVSGNGWANVASIDIIYDILHMMGRDDIPVGRGNTTALGTPSLGCHYVSIIPQGSGGLIDSDTLYGLPLSLPRSPRRYTSENSVKYGAPRNTDHPELRQPLAFEVWQTIEEQLDPNEKITILTNGPLTNLANIVLSDRDAISVIEKVYLVGGHIRDENDSKGNVFTVPSNRYAEFNVLLDPLAAKTVLESSLDITLIPLVSQRKAASFQFILHALKHVDHTPESGFVRHLLLLLYDLQQKHRLYNHMDMFLGEVLGAVYLVEGLNIKPSLQAKSISIVSNSTISTDGQIVINKESANSVKVLGDFSSEEYYKRVANSLGNMKQTAVITSFEEQTIIWSRPPVKLEA
ncbi:hypothetical protein C2845_PM06G22090 [Panicum miliaceum]|uniref:Inosine/uridine-preferring nucleoside hydrolase domain-containing protein n=1 Tax=Panicum miliaceum TaxID=4540 RepID=A0A3L6REQ6_PANMI|nr:hypothetical protein C2845_PM06G22090 [Panicum miliaceum]